MPSSAWASAKDETMTAFIATLTVKEDQTAEFEKLQTELSQTADGVARVEPVLVGRLRLAGRGGGSVSHPAQSRLGPRAAVA